MQEYWRSILRGLKPEIRDSLTLEKALSTARARGLWCASMRPA